MLWGQSEASVSSLFALGSRYGRMGIRADSFVAAAGLVDAVASKAARTRLPACPVISLLEPVPISLSASG
jgi:hypothetical protein